MIIPNLMQNEGVDCGLKFNGKGNKERRVEQLKVTGFDDKFKC